MPTNPAQVEAPRRLPPIAFLLVLVVAVLLYIGMVACLFESHSPHVDAFGRGFAALFAVAFGLILWIMLGILLLIAAVKGEMPRAAAIAAFILLPLSAIAAAVTVDPGTDAPWWLPLVPFLLPPPIAAVAIWARFPVLHRALSPNPTGTVLLGIVVALTVAPVPYFVADQIRQFEEARRDQAARQAAEAAENERRQQNLARFQTLTDDSPLWEWAPFFGKQSELDTEAIAAASKLTHRQADAEAAMRRGIGFPLVEFERLDLAATPSFCAAAGDFLSRNAAAHAAAASEADFQSVYQHFSPYLEGIEWLTGKNCDLDDEVARIRGTIDGYKPTPSRDAHLAILAWRRGNGFYNRREHDRAIAEYDAALRLSPDNAQFFYSRGNAFYEQQQYDRAIADYTEAIRRNDGYSAAWDSRANAYYFKGDMEQALRDYDAAIQRNPDKANAYNNRANVFVRNSQFDRALQDYDKALQLQPNFRVALGNRGRARFYQAAYAPAAEDLAAELALKPDDPYAALWLYLARLRAGQPARDRLREEAAQLGRDGWPWPIVAVFLGDSDATAVLTDLRGSTAGDRRARQCEAGFYFGAQSAAQVDTTTARELLQQATAICPADFIEMTGAKYELARLP